MSLTSRADRQTTPKVSVLVPCYNVEKYLPQCLESLVSQTLKDIEVICINDGSTDSTLDIIRRFQASDPRIKVIDKANSGYGASMNLGLDLAQGEYVGITESDDFASPDMYRTLYRCARKHDLDIAKSSFYNFYGGKDHIEETFKRFPSKTVIDPADYPGIVGATPSVWAAIYRTDMIRRSGMRFNETPGASFQDTGFVLKGWFAARRVMLLPGAYLHYRNDNPNSSVKSSTKIYAVCDEFESADEFMNADPERRRKFISQFNGHRFNTYWWNYNRIADDFHREFAERMREDMLLAQKRGELFEGGFTPENWVLLEKLLRDVDDFVGGGENLAPIQEQVVTSPLDIRLFVSCREGVYVPKLPFLEPIQVGVALSGKRIAFATHDDDGDGISDRFPVFKELTAQYWAWKNVSADYYGFMQDRRYLEFESSGKPSDECGVVAYGMPSDACFEELGYREAKICSLIEQNDIIVGQEYVLPDSCGEPSQRVRAWYANDWRKDGADLDRLSSIVKERYPEFAQDLDACLAKDSVLPFNVFAMNGELFGDYSSFLFGCLFEFSESLDVQTLSPFAAQAPEFLSVLLLGAFIEHCKRTRPDIRIHHARNGYFNCADKPYLEPAFDQNNCPIVFSSSDYYSVFAGVAIQSIMENASPETNYDIIVLDTGMRDATRMLLQRQLAGRANFSIRFLNIERELNARNLPSAHHITIGTFGRFLILDHLVGYDKVVYLDCDLVVNADIADLYNVDLGDCLVAAVRDTAGNGWYNIPGNEMRDHMDKVLDISEPCGYFNAGVLVMNLARLRQVTTCEELMRSAVDPKWMWLDQDVLNHVCRGRVKYLDQAWNYMAHKESYSTPWSLPEAWLPKWLQDEYAAAQANPHIVHYVGRSIPCFAPEADCYWYFWKYARTSLFYERILKIAMSETVEHEQMSTIVHAQRAVRGVKEALKGKLEKRFH